MLVAPKTVERITIDPDLAIKYLTKLSHGWDQDACDNFLKHSFCCKPMVDTLNLEAESILMRAYNEIIYAVALNERENVSKYAKVALKMLDRNIELFKLSLQKVA